MSHPNPEVRRTIFLAPWGLAWEWMGDYDPTLMRGSRVSIPYVYMGIQCVGKFVVTEWNWWKCRTIF